MDVFMTGMSPAREHLIHAAALLGTVCAARFLGYPSCCTARRRGTVSHRTVILGAGPVGTHLAIALLERREYGLDPAGFVDVTFTRNQSEGIHLRLRISASK